MSARWLSKEVGLALRALRTCRTHLDRARTRHPTTKALENLCLIHQQGLYSAEADLRATLAKAIDHDNELLALSAARVAKTETKLRGVK